MLFQHGNVTDQPPTPHRAFRRFVAILDVLGMKEWLKAADPKSIAERMDAALVASEQSSRGRHGDGRSYGPLISTTYFSDTVLAWSPDDSWTSFAAMCSAISMIVTTALPKGVPIRGSISVGEAVCNGQRLRFVGPPIADAYRWSEYDRPYRSVGVDITPSALSDIRAKLAREPLPPHWDGQHTGFRQAVLERQIEATNSLVWYQDGLFLNHWAHGTFNGRDPRQMLGLRGLPDTAAAREKEAEMMAFFEESRATTRRQQMADHRDGSAMLSDFGDVVHQFDDYLRLDQMRLARAPW